MRELTFTWSGGELVIRIFKQYLLKESFYIFKLRAAAELQRPMEKKIGQSKLKWIRMNE